HPLSGSDGRMSPIQSVMERLNRATTPDTTASGSEDATQSTSVGASQRPWPAAGASKPDAPALPSVSTNGVGKQNQIVSIQTQNALPESTKRDGIGQP